AVDTATVPFVFAHLIHPVVRQNLPALNRRLDPEYRTTRRKRMPNNFLRQMRDSQAHVGLCHLERVDDDSLWRIRNAGLYNDGLVGLNSVILPEFRKDLSNIYTYFPIQLTERTRLLEYSRMKRRDFAAQHLRNCADLPMFSEFYRDCPNAR